jgi:hypothetical protein
MKVVSTGELQSQLLNHESGFTLTFNPLPILGFRVQVLWFIIFPEP